MTNASTSEPLMPSQRAREFSWEARPGAFRDGDPATREKWMAGYCDHTPVVQAFARFEASLKEAAPAMTREAVERRARQIVAQTATELGYCAEDAEIYRSGNLDGDDILPVRAVEEALTTIAKQETDSVREAWQPIETAPKDGTEILAWCVHPNAEYEGTIAEKSEWQGPVVAHWIDHNGGGWTWHGMLGRFTHWQPLPTPPAALSTDPTS